MRNTHRAWVLVTCGVLLVALFCARVLLHRGRARRPPAGIPDRSLTNPLNQPGGGLAPAEAYEPYSSLYQSDMGEPLVFVSESDTDIPQLDGSCLRPSNAAEQEMNDAFVKANEKSHHWQENFAIPAGYRLVSRREATQVLFCLDTQGQSPGVCSKYQGVRHIRFLGAPGFDHTHTRALVSVIRKCGDHCGSGGIFVVEKTAGTWRRSEVTEFTRNCSWMY